MTDWDAVTDVVIVGSGGGALTGAFVSASEGMRTLVLESTDKFGGTTCYSGGAVWLPGNQASMRAGLDDTNDMALTYFQQVVGDRTPSDLQQAFVRNGPAVIEYLERSPHLQFTWMPFPDYYGDRGCPPAHARGRDVLLDPLPMAELGEFEGKLRLSMASDIAGLSEPDPLLGGRALVGRLLLAVAGTDHAELRLNTEMESLILEEGRVVGVEAVSNGRRLRFRARRGVLMAAGGFERNQSMRDEYRMAGNASWSCGAPGGTGKAIRAGMAIGAATDLMTECWWAPGLLQPNGRCGYIATVNGGIIVNKDGRRVGNETGPYDRFGRAMRASDPDNARVEAWWIWDATLGPCIPYAYNSMPVLDREIYERAGLWKQGATLADLAREIAVPADALSETVERFNTFAANGVDEDFHRGESPYDLYIANEFPAIPGMRTSPRVGTPNPCLIPIATGPFYAAKVVLSDLGSKGGLKTDAHARVLRENGAVIPGLYAAGDTMASAAGEAYPAPGTPIGTCMVFSYLAVMDMAAADAAQSGSE